LIAVVAVSGILMALLLPALSSAKEKSRRSVCGNNEHQFVLALTYFADEHEWLLPSALDNSGNYHSVILSSQTFSNILGYTFNESNILYCPNLVQAVSKMGGYNPQTGYTIGYNYLATTALPGTPKGPDMGWTGPMDTTEASEVVADANYWVKNTSQALTVAPHTSGGPVAMASIQGSTASSSLTALSPGSSSTAAGAMGGNIGSLDGSVVWLSIHLMGQYPASGDGSANGNW
jgi:hypothetical protein